MYKDEIVTRKFTTPENYNHQLHKKRATEKAEVESAAHLRSQVISGMISEPLNHSSLINETIERINQKLITFLITLMIKRKAKQQSEKYPARILTLVFG